MRKIALLCFFLIIKGYSLDEYLPISPQSFEFKLSVTKSQYTQLFDSNGETTNIQDIDPAQALLNVQFKYGILRGLDLEAEWAIGAFNKGVLKDKVTKGALRPAIGLKYAYLPLGIGGFLNYHIPLATGELFPNDPGTGIEVGLLYGLQSSLGNLYGTISYNVELEDADGFNPGDEFQIFIKPEVVLAPSLSIYTSLDWVLHSVSTSSNEALVQNSGYKLISSQGIKLYAKDRGWLDISFSGVGMGKNTHGEWKANTSLFITLNL